MATRGMRKPLYGSHTTSTVVVVPTVVMVRSVQIRSTMHGTWGELWVVGRGRGLKVVGRGSWVVGRGLRVQAFELALPSTLRQLASQSANSPTRQLADSPTRRQTYHVDSVVQELAEVFDRVVVVLARE